ncbi:MAG: transglutaminase-like domain-containing protein [Bacillota bacterium]|nr:transglutaminase-like domain-containing protein [Bacillota bacterium]
MKKILVLFFCMFVFFYLSSKNALPSLKQMEGLFDHKVSNLLGNSSLKVVSPTLQQKLTTQQPVKNILKSAPTEQKSKYPTQVIQTYRVSVSNGKLLVTGKPTPYGKYYKADGIILYIQEQRANTKTTIKVPFTNGAIHYEYPLHYNVGEVILNLNELYKGKVDDPNKVLGYAVFHLTDGDPYLLPSFMVQSNNPTLVSLAHRITNGKSTNVEKSRAIFEWVAKNISYNDRLVNSTNPPLYSALQTYQSRVVLCSGYADLSAALHRAVGIETKVMYGQNHAWDEVKLNGKWQPEDPTYGSGFININTSKFVHSYHPAYFTKTDMHMEGEYPW